MSLKLMRCRRGLKYKTHFAAKLQEVTNISRKIKFLVRGYDRMMLGGYK